MPSDLWKKLLVAMLPTMLLLIAAEAVLRLSGAADTCPTYQTSKLWSCDPILYFKTNPNLAIAGGLNSQGFRGREFARKKRDVFRILALGDSCTFGVTAVDDGLFAKEPYPQLLERLIAERAGPDKVEVFNGGVPGYNTYQAVMLLRTKLRGLHPDLITVRYGWNDHLMSPENRLGNAFREPGSAFLRSLQDLLLRTKLYPFSQRLGMELHLRLQPAAPSGPALLPPEWKPNVPLQEYEHNLRRIIALGRAQGAEVWLLTSPYAFLTPQILAKYEALPDTALPRNLLKLDRIPSFKRMMEIHDAYNAATRAVAAELHVRMIDLAAIYRQHADQRLFSMLDILHPDQQGHELEAETLYAELVTAGVLRGRGGRYSIE